MHIPENLDINHMMRLAFFILASIFSIWIFDELMFKSVNTLVIAGHAPRLIITSLICIAIIWRVSEILIKYLPHKIRHLSTIRSSTQNLINPYYFISLCLLSILAYQLPILGAYAGIQWQGGFANQSDIAGVLPYADAKQYFSAALTMPLFHEMGSLAARRPAHSANLASMFVLTGFHRFAVLALQASLCGFSLILACVYVSRLLGPAVAITVWAIIYGLSIDALPTFMTAPTGIWTGLIAFTLLFASILHRKPIMLALSLGVFMLAFSIRAGAYFILPMLFLVGIWSVRRNRKSLVYFLIATVFAVSLSMCIPRIINGIYNTRGGAYQGNYINILYMLSVGSTDWRQLYRDYPGAKKTIRPADKWLEFAKMKTRQAFYSKPSIFFKTGIEILSDAVFNLPYAYFRSIIQPNLSRESIARFNSYRYLFNTIFYGGLLFLLIGTALTLQLRIAFLLVLIGYTLSLPFIWLGFATRFQAVTFLIPSLAIAGIMAHKGSSSPPFSPKFSLYTCFIFYTWFIATIFIPLLFQNIFSFDLNKLRITPLPNGEFRSFILAGPHMPTLRFRQDDKIYIRPDISINKFKNLHTMQYVGRKTRFGYSKVGEQLTMTLDVNFKNVKIYYSKPFCIPDRLWVYQATISNLSPPYAYHLKNIQPVDYKGHTLPKDKPFPFNCM